VYSLSQVSTKPSNSGDIKSKKAVYVWIGGIVFSILFTALIWLLGPNLNHFIQTFLPYQGGFWYYWKLPTRNFFSMAIVWIFYLINQILVWGTIYWAQKHLNEQKVNPTYDLTKYNLIIITIMVPFIFLHLLQTQIWFDGLAQDTPIWSSMGSVIVLLAMVIIMQNPISGLFLGKKAGKPYTSSVVDFFRHNHMYIFAWALVYTFWFHPMASYPQILSGFFYMFLLFTQMSLAYTKVHLDQRWIVTLQSWVAVHAVIVAFFNHQLFGGADIWPMFFTGFVFMFVFTYMYALKMRTYLRWIITITYIAFVMWLYVPKPIGFGRDPSFFFRLEFLWIPIILYGLSFLFALIVLLWVNKKKKKEIIPV
jgi:hypothetical protein